jgi:hypothetical protein
MRLRAASALAVLCVAAVSAADSPARRALSSEERAALLALIKAVDLAQETDVVSPVALPWSADALKSTDVAYVPFRLDLAPLSPLPKSAAMYVRAVSRHDGVRTKEEDSSLREWVVRGGSAPPNRSFDTVVFNPGELPIGGLAVTSSRRSVAAPAEASALLALQEKQIAQEKAAEETARRREEVRQRDPYRFPFEEYYFFDVKAPRVERALGVPPGEYDVFVAVIDRARGKTSSPVVVRHTISVPDFWNLELQLSDLILVSDVRTLSSALQPKQQAEHPYTWGRVEVVPAEKTAFDRSEILKVVYQLCNYGAPDTDVFADYNFYWQVAGQWTLFNRTAPQELGEADLPAPVAFETQGFVMQAVPLAPFPPGDYRLDVVVRDRLTRGNAKQSINFTVK